MTKEEAIEVYKGLINTKIKEAFEFFAPELRESEDERIRKGLIEALKTSKTIGELKFILPEPTREEGIAYLEKMKDTNKAIEAVERIDKYIDEHLVNAHDMKDSNPDKKYYQGWDDALGKMAGILQDVYSGKKQKEHKEENLRDFIDNFPYSDKQKEQKPNLVPKIIRPKFAVGDTVCRPMWSDHTVREIYIDCDDPVYVCINEEGTESHISFSEQDEWKRKEQKPAEWSKVDKNRLEEAIEVVEANGCWVRSDDAVKQVSDFLKSLPERFNLQPKQEWSEEDEKMLDKVCCLISPGTILNASDADYCLELKQWIVSLQERILKSLRPQPKKNDILTPNKKFFQWIYDRLVNVHNEDPNVDYMTSFKRRIEEFPVDEPSWKPSKEQMGALNYAYCELFKREDVGHNILGPLQNLIDTLTKL